MKNLLKYFLQIIFGCYAVLMCCWAVAKLLMFHFSYWLLVHSVQDFILHGFLLYLLFEQFKKEN